MQEGRSATPLCCADIRLILPPTDFRLSPWRHVGHRNGRIRAAREPQVPMLRFGWSLAPGIWHLFKVWWPCSDADRALYSLPIRPRKLPVHTVQGFSCMQLVAAGRVLPPPPLVGYNSPGHSINLDPSSFRLHWRCTLLPFSALHWGIRATAPVGDAEPASHSSEEEGEECHRCARCTSRCACHSAVRWGQVQGAMLFGLFSDNHRVKITQVGSQLTVLAIGELVLTNGGLQSHDGGLWITVGDLSATDRRHAGINRE